MDSKVLLPEPLGPSTAIDSVGATERSMPCSTTALESWAKLRFSTSTFMRRFDPDSGPIWIFTCPAAVRKAPGSVTFLESGFRTPVQLPKKRREKP